MRLIETGFLLSVSVGFRVLDEPVRNASGGVDFVGRKELLELSAVNVPSNVDARISAGATLAMQKWLGARGAAAEIVLQLAAEQQPRTRSDARHSASDRELIDHIHQDAVDLGATCAGAPAGDDLERALDRYRARQRPADDDAIVRFAPETIAMVQASAARQRRTDPTADPFGVRHHVAGESRYDVDPVMLARALREVIPAELRALVRAEADKALRLARGRVD